MSEIKQAAAESDRIHALDSRIIVALGKIAAPSNDIEASEHGQIYRMLPAAMTANEINNLGLRVSTLVERIAPSRNLVSRGKRSEIRATRWVGSASLLHGDRSTYESARMHLKTKGVRGKLAAFALWYEDVRN